MIDQEELDRLQKEQAKRMEKLGEEEDAANKVEREKLGSAYLERRARDAAKAKEER